MISGTVALLVRQGIYFLAIVYVDLNGKLLSINSNGCKSKINNRQVIFQTSISLSIDKFNWLYECESIEYKIAIPFLWQLSIDHKILSIEDLANLYWGSEYKSQELCSLLLSMYAGPVSYFKLNDNMFCPLSELIIKEQNNQEQIRKKLQAEQDEFYLWISNGVMIQSWSDRQVEWVDTLKEFVFFDGEFSDLKKVRKLLSSIKLNGNISTLREQTYNYLVDREIISATEPIGQAKLLQEKNFPKEVLAETCNINEHNYANNRLDLTNINVITIDESSTMDIDDGLSIQFTDDGFIVGIHITDVDSIFSEESSIDIEARSRLSSFYAPEITVPMLPEKISYNIGSLIPGSIRPAMTLLINFQKDYIVKDWEVVLSFIKSKRRLNYDEVDHILNHLTDDEMSHELEILDETARHLHERRLNAGGIEFNGPDIKFEFNNGLATMKSIQKITHAHRLVSEFMILLNTLLAEMCYKNNIPAIYRSSVKLNSDAILDTSVDALKNYYVLSKVRSVAPSTVSSPHFLLGVDRYIQVSSPLRRYGDLILQRQISYFLKNNTPLYGKIFMDRFISDSSGKLRDISRTESDRKMHWVFYLLSGRINEIFPCIALEWRASDLYVEFQDFQVRGIVKTNKQINLGEVIDAKLINVNLWQRKTILSA